MIKCNESKVKFKGSEPQLCTELAIVTKNLVDAMVEKGRPREEAVALVEKSMKVGLMTEEERHAEAQQRLGKLLMHLGGAMVDDSEEEGEQ